MKPKYLTMEEIKVLDHALMILEDMDSEFIKKSERRIAEKIRDKFSNTRIAWIAEEK